MGGTATQAPETAFTRRVFVLSAGPRSNVFYHIYSPSTFLWSPGRWRWWHQDLYTALFIVLASAAAAVECGVEPHWPPIEMWSLDNNGRALVPWLYLCVDVSV